LGRCDNAVRNQQNSGRCWLYAASAVLANKKVVRKGGELPELSTSYWNYLALRRRAFAVIDKQVGEKGSLRRMAKNLAEGGEFPQALELVREYGAVPELAMPSAVADAVSSGVMVSLLARLLAQGVDRIAVVPQDDKAGREKVAAELKGQIENMLSTAIGAPPERFEVEGKLYTPRTYCDQFLGIGPDDLRYVALFSRPHARKEKHEMKDDLGGFATFEAKEVQPSELCRLAQKGLDAGEALYFATNASADNPHLVPDSAVEQVKRGILSLAAFDYASYVPAPVLAKIVRLDAQVDGSNHGMVLTGYDYSDRHGAVRKWLVNNSHGTDRADHGRLHMYADYFQHYVEKLYVPDAVLSAEDRAQLQLE
jgi:aminopeptidase C